MHNRTCGACQNHKSPHWIDQHIIGYSYESVLKQLIIQMKFNRKPAIAKFLGTLITSKVKASKFSLLYDHTSIIPIPIDRFRLAYRGFNPTHEIAKEIARQTGFRIERQTLIKRSFFIPQNQLNKKERINNLKNAFLLQRRPTKHVLLVDDVLTTGTTLKAAAQILKKAGTKTVTAIVIAKA